MIDEIPAIAAVAVISFLLKSTRQVAYAGSVTQVGSVVEVHSQSPPVSVRMAA